MARREMRWWRYLCEGRRRGGTPCDAMILVCAVDGGAADAKAIDEYGWKPQPKAPCGCDCHDRKRPDDDPYCQSCRAIHDGTTGDKGWLCELTHKGEYP